MHFFLSLQMLNDKDDDGSNGLILAVGSGEGSSVNHVVEGSSEKHVVKGSSVNHVVAKKEPPELLTLQLFVLHNYDKNFSKFSRLLENRADASRGNRAIRVRIMKYCTKEDLHTQIW